MISEPLTGGTGRQSKQLDRCFASAWTSSLGGVNKRPPNAAFRFSGTLSGLGVACITVARRRV